MTVAAAITRARHRHRASLTAGCTIRRKTGETYDPSTATTVPIYDDVYTGPCLVRPQSLQGREALYGDRAVSLSTYDLHLPVDVEPERADEVTVTAAADPLLVDRQMVVAHVPADEWLVVRRVVCEDQQ